MHFRYGIDDKPEILPLLLYGIQWLAVSIPTTIILGKVIASTFGHPELTIFYLQKLFLITGLVMGIQVIWGHRLPLLTGPATVLLIGILASMEVGMGAINGAIILSGGLLAVLGLTGLFGHLKKLFTPRVVTAILFLVAVTLSPTILDLMVPAGTTDPTNNYIFALGLVLLTFAAHGVMKGIWKSTITIWVAIFGTLGYFLFFGLEQSMGNFPLVATPLTEPLVVLAMPNIGVIFSFLVCMLALSINDLGSIQALGALTEAEDMESRISKGLTVTGLGNVFSGLLGVVGPVNFSLSSGVILASGCASRYALLPAAGVLVAISFSPGTISILSSIPLPVISSIMIYIATAQMASGLLMGQSEGITAKVEEGLVVGLPVILGIVVTFLPQEVIAHLPLLWRPILANGFVVGTLAVFIFEHLIYRQKS